MTQILELLGAALILGPYVFATLGKLAPSARRYLWPNIVGAALLAILALTTRQWGFVLLEGAWTVVSLWKLFAPR